MRLHEPSPPTRQQSCASKSHCACYVAYKTFSADPANRLILCRLRLETIGLDDHALGQFAQQIKKTGSAPMTNLCARISALVIARSVSDEAIQLPAQAALDCFADARNDASLVRPA
jgi:hypothetical protein